MKSRMVLTIPVPVPDHIFTALCDYMDEVRCKHDISALAGAAIAKWIADARRRAAESDPKPLPGYQWKAIFLPTGTQLKTIVRGRTFHAVVEGDQVVHDGQAVTPHEFANMFGVSGRNAWRDVWLYLPYEPVWQPAATIRKKTRGA